MGTRGHAGGLAESTLQALLILDAAGKDVVFLETVGTGQSEIGVLSIADTVVLALMPGSGDSVQALKAGIMEIPDVIAVNKRDHPLAADDGERRAAGARARARAPQPPIVLTEALRGDGVDELWARSRSIAPGSRPTGCSRSAARGTSRRRCSRSPRRARAAIWRMRSPTIRSWRAPRAVERRELDPLTAVHEILGKVFHIDDEDDPDTR